MVLANTQSPINEARVDNEACTYQQEKEAKHCSVDIPIKNEITDSTVEEIKKPEDQKEMISRRTRSILFIICIIALIVGRSGVPDEEFENVKDRVMDALQAVNDFINASGNEMYRDLMQMACSFLVDIVFLATFGFWVVKGKNARLPITMAIFYVVRALVQKVWVSPFPQGFYWEAPLLPSLVVPYGRGSDFFFSGHSGFLVICAAEWHKIKMPKMRNFSIVALIYTIFILLTFRIHYSIDVFTGVFFAEWCFGKVDLHLESINNFFAQIFGKIRKIFGGKNDEMIHVDQVLVNNLPKAVECVV